MKWFLVQGRILVSGSPGLSGSDFDPKSRKSGWNDCDIFCSRFKNCLLQVWKNLLLVWKLHGSRFQKLHKTCSSFRKKFKPGATHPKTRSQTILSQDPSKFKSGAKNFQTWSWMFFKRATFYFKLEISCFEIWSRKIDLMGGVCNLTFRKMVYFLGVNSSLKIATLRCIFWIIRAVFLLFMTNFKLDLGYERYLAGFLNVQLNL